MSFDLLCVKLAAVRLLRPSWRLATQLLFVGLLGIVLHTFGDYGMSWDQQYRQSEGAKKLVYYQNLLAGQWQPYDSKEDLYPGFYDLVLQIVNLAEPCGPGVLGLIYTDHLLTALAGLLTLWAAYKIARSLAGRRAGFFAALFLACFPHFYGHMFINPKDIPFACGYLWSLYLTLKLLHKPLTGRLILLITLAYGLTLGVRTGGIFLFGFLGLALVCRAWLDRARAPFGPALARGVGLGALVAGGAFLVLLPWWPFAHPDPVGTLLHTLGRVASYPWSGPVLLAGKVYPSTELPWSYLPHMLAVTTPIFILTLSFLGLIFAIISLVRGLWAGGASYFTPRRLSVIFLGLAILLPMAAVILKNSTLYDGIRHFLFVLGPWAVLAALAFDRLLHFLQDISRRWASPLARGAPTAAWAFVALGVGAVGLQNIQLHPYQYVYYNQLAGGVEGACLNYETDYWGTSHREAVELLAQHLARQGDHKVYRVSSPMAPWLVQNFLPSNMIYVTDPRQADFFISFLRFNAHMWSDGTVMEDCIVERQGMPLALVRDRRAIVKAQADALQKGKPSTVLISSLLHLLPLGL